MVSNLFPFLTPTPDSRCYTVEFKLDFIPCSHVYKKVLVTFLTKFELGWLKLKEITNNDKFCTHMLGCGVGVKSHE